VPSDGTGPSKRLGKAFLKHVRTALGELTRLVGLPLYVAMQRPLHCITAGGDPSRRGRLNALLGEKLQSRIANCVTFAHADESVR